MNRLLGPQSYLIFLLLFLCGMLQAQPDEKGSFKKEPVFHTAVPDQLYTIILGRPGAHEITISILPTEDLNGWVEYSVWGDEKTKNSEKRSWKRGETTCIVLSSLSSGSRFRYRLLYQHLKDGKKGSSSWFGFHTQRKTNEGFVFNVQADSHLDENTGTDMYLQTLSNIASDSADFLVDLGDTWMTDKYRSDYHTSAKQYVAQRYYFGQTCHSTPLFLVLGNHDGESGKSLSRGGSDNMASWATSMRQRFFPNPVPDGFYSGNPERVGNYYAWEWGNAQFIVLDPFRYTNDQRNPWNRTLGKVQYDWLKKTLSSSSARFRFVFIHNLVGGVDRKGIARGGAEAARFFEWGGENADSSYGFFSNRRGWDKPIHNLLVEYKVDVVFHGHDHFFARQEKDGIIYQLVPQPGALRYGHPNTASEYGYVSGVLKNGPGYMRVRVEADQAIVDLMQSGLNQTRPKKAVVYSYTISPKY